MIRLVFFYWHRMRADTWRRRASAAMERARRQFVFSRLQAQRADEHDARAEALYPQSSTGPPSDHVVAHGAPPGAQQDGP